MIRPAQIRSEIIQFLRILEALKPRRILELGTAGGGTLFLFARVAAPDATLVSVDLPEGSDAGGYLDWRESLYRIFAGSQQAMRLVRADSHDVSCLRAVRAALGGESTDVLFIDADHSYSGVATDFELYAPLVREGGLVGLHDIVPDHRTKYGKPTESYSGDVFRFWAAVRERYPHSEIVDDPDQDGFGIGVLRIGRMNH